MGEKSAQKKQFILETARGVFMQKGFKNVTMKDIVEECGISRGGLYLYFESTRELFWEVLLMETAETDDVFEKNIPQDATVTEILLLFFKEQKKEILRKKNNLTVAIYEFFFENKPARKDNLLRNRFDTAAAILQELIEAGIEAGEFYETDTLATARNMMFAIEGMKVSAQTMGLTEKAVDEEFAYLLQNLVIMEEEP